MKNLNVVCAIILNEKKQIFVCQRPMNKSLGGMWEFPGGKIEINETHKETLKREIKEELNSDIEIMSYLGSTYYEYLNISNPFSINLHAYICKVTTGNLELIEHINALWINISDIDNINFAPADKYIIKKLKEYLN